jgi:hypothetical protein
MSKAKVTQEQADAYMDGWGAHHNGWSLELAKKNFCKNNLESLLQCFIEGWEDSARGSIDFDKIMGPNDFEPDVP